MAELTTPVRGVLGATDTALSGVGQIGYGVVVGDTGDDEDWLVEGGTEDGIWTLTTPANTWARRSDLDASGDFDNMPSVRVREGNQGIEGSVWYYDGAQDPTIGSDPLTFTPGALGRPALAGLGLEHNYPYIQLPEQASAEGSHDLGIFSQAVDDRGVITHFDVGAAGEMFVYGMTLSVPSALFIDVSQGAAFVPSRGNMAEQGHFGDSSYLLEDEPTGIASGKLYYLYVSHYGQPVSPYYYLSPVEPVSDTLDGPPFVKGPVGSEDLSRRYLGALRSASTSAFYKQSTEGLGSSLTVSYLTDTTASAFRVVSGGTATTNQTVGLGSVVGTDGTAKKLVPPKCRMVYARVSVNTTALVWIDNPEMSTSPQAGTGYAVVTTVERVQYIWIPLDTNQSFRWANSVAGGSTSVDIKAYVDRR